jgi:hypothetical protein
MREAPVEKKARRWNQNERQEEGGTKTGTRTRESGASLVSSRRLPSSRSTKRGGARREEGAQVEPERAFLLVERLDGSRRDETKLAPLSRPTGVPQGQANRILMPPAHPATLPTRQEEGGTKTGMREAPVEKKARRWNQNEPSSWWNDSTEADVTRPPQGQANRILMPPAHPATLPTRQEEGGTKTGTRTRDGAAECGGGERGMFAEDGDESEVFGCCG